MTKPIFSLTLFSFHLSAVFDVSASTPRLLSATSFEENTEKESLPAADETPSGAPWRKSSKLQHNVTCPPSYDRSTASDESSEQRSFTGLAQVGRISRRTEQESILTSDRSGMARRRWHREE